MLAGRLGLFHISLPLDRLSLNFPIAILSDIVFFIDQTLDTSYYLMYDGLNNKMNKAIINMTLDQAIKIIVRDILEDKLNKLPKTQKEKLEFIDDYSVNVYGFSFGLENLQKINDKIEEATK